MATVAGATLATAGTAGAVTRGTEADAGEYPWMVALQDADGHQFCGGAVIAADLVVTAAHCVEGTTSADVEVAAGSTTLGDPDAQVRRVAEIRVHPDYDTRWVDAAVLHLASPLDLGDRVAPIAVADAAEQASLLGHGSPATVTGWGATSEDGDGTTQLREADVTIVGDDRCAQLADGEFEPATELCAHSPTGQDSCYGDSGGPLVVTDPGTGRSYLAGIVSYGLAECGGDLPGVYADAAGIAPFLRSGGEGGVAPSVGEDDAWDDWTDEDDWDDEGSADEEAWTDPSEGWANDGEIDELDRDLAIGALMDALACVADGGGLECLEDALDRAYADAGW